MKSNTKLASVACLVVAALTLGEAAAQQLLPGEREAAVTAIDSAGRLYVSAAKGIHVLSPEGKHLGLIPTPRRPISIAFSGTDKKSMYVPMLGAVGPNGKEWATPEGVRNTGMTIYKIQMLAEGFKGRPK